MLIQLKLKRFRVHLSLKHPLVLVLFIELFCVDGEGHGTHVLLLAQSVVIVVFWIVWILQIQWIGHLIEVFSLSSTAVFEFIRWSVAVEIVVQVRLSLLHSWTVAHLDIIDSVTNA